MKRKFALSTALILLAGGLAFAGSSKKAGTPPAAVTPRETRVKEFKDILFKLVRQDEYLDEAIEVLDTSSGRPNAQDLSALGVSLRSITGSLRQVAALNKTEFTAIQPGSDLTRYTNAILSYSKKVDRKAVRLGAALAGLTASSRKAAMRDAVASKKGGGKAGGRKLTQILAERKAMKKLAVEARKLRGASRGLTATSKWLYIASR